MGTMDCGKKGALRWGERVVKERVPESSRDTVMRTCVERIAQWREGATKSALPGTGRGFAGRDGAWPPLLRAWAAGWAGAG